MITCGQRTGRVAYAEIRADEKAETAVEVLRNAGDWLAERGVAVERVLSDNGSFYRSFAWRDACDELGITAKRTRPYRPQTNCGKICALPPHAVRRLGLRPPLRLRDRPRRSLQPWLHFYSHHRAHSAIGGLPPINRLNNLPGHHG
jgi:transposase InsO family protein